MLLSIDKWVAPSMGWLPLLGPYASHRLLFPPPWLVGGAVRERAWASKCVCWGFPGGQEGQWRHQRLVQETCIWNGANVLCPSQPPGPVLSPGDIVLQLQAA